MCLLRLLELLASKVQSVTSQTNVITPASFVVITPASFVVDRARFCDMNEKVKNEEPFNMHKHKAIAMMKWSCRIDSVIPPNVDYM